MPLIKQKRFTTAAVACTVPPICHSDSPFSKVSLFPELGHTSNSSSSNVFAVTVLLYGPHSTLSNKQLSKLPEQSPGQQIMGI